MKANNFKKPIFLGGDLFMLVALHEMGQVKCSRWNVFVASYESGATKFCGTRFGLRTSSQD
jgi:hypothetical protein